MAKNASTRALAPVPCQFSVFFDRNFDKFIKVLKTVRNTWP